RTAAHEFCREIELLGHEMLLHEWVISVAVIETVGRHDPAVMAMRRSRRLLEQVLENQWAPDSAACLHQGAALVELAEVDRGEAEPLGKVRHQRCRALVVAGQEHDPAAARGVWVG